MVSQDVAGGERPAVTTADRAVTARPGGRLRRVDHPALQSRGLAARRRHHRPCAAQQLDMLVVLIALTMYSEMLLLG